MSLSHASSFAHDKACMCLFLWSPSTNLCNFPFPQKDKVPISLSLQVCHNLNMRNTLWLLSLSFLSLSLRCQTRYSNPSFSCSVLEFMDNSFPGYYFACTQPNHTHAFTNYPSLSVRKRNFNVGTNYGGGKLEASG